MIALSLETWIKLIPLMVLGGLFLFFLWGWLMRNLEEVSTARRFGWRELSEFYASPDDLSNLGWQRVKQLFMTRRLAQAYQPWHIYLACEFAGTPQGLALKWRGRFRRKSVPLNHPPLLLPWDALSVGSFETLRGHRRQVVLFTLPQCPGVAIALRPAEARHIATQSGGRLRIPGPPPPST